MSAPPPIEFTLEQKFSRRSFELQVQAMDRKQAIAALIELYKQMMLCENKYKQMVEQQWGIQGARSSS